MIRWYAAYPKSGLSFAQFVHRAYEDPERFDINYRPIHHIVDTDLHFHVRVSPAPLDQLSEAEAMAVHAAALVHMIREQGRPYVKTHAARGVIPETQLPLVPDALTERAVYVMRDPRDVAVSFTDHMKDWSIDDAIRFMARKNAVVDGNARVHMPMTTWSDHVRSWRDDPPFPVLGLRYEDMLEHPACCFRALLEFWAIDLDEQRLTAALALTSFDRLRAVEKQEGYRWKSAHQERFFRQGRAGAWRSALTAEQVSRIEADHGDVMASLGYL